MTIEDIIALVVRETTRSSWDDVTIAVTGRRYERLAAGFERESPLQSSPSGMPRWAYGDAEG